MTADESGAVCLPPGPRLPRVVQEAAFITRGQRTLRLLHRIYGPSVTAHMPGSGPTVVISEPRLIKQLFQAKTDIVGPPEPDLGIVFGSGSVFALDGAEHLRRRRLLIPALNGARLKTYELIMEEEVRREIEHWPTGVEFPTLTPMMRLTLNIILRVVFGAEGAEFDHLRRLLPPMVTLGSKLVGIPFLRPDLGRWSPGGRYLAYRRRFDAIVGSLIDKALADPRRADRPDVLSLLAQARYEDGEAISRRQLADELLTLLAAGHETTATTLAWAFERISRHPAVHRRLTEEVDAGGSELLQATILEVQRTRPVIDATVRTVKADAYRLGSWVIPRGHTVMVAIESVHHSEAVFPRAASFDPDRFIGVKPDNYAWVPFGGGTRRCAGAAFANLEMNVALRTILGEFRLDPTDAPAERSRSRGVAFAPADGGRVVVRRRSARNGGSPASAVHDDSPAGER